MMKPDKILALMSAQNIPLADIETVMEGYFHVPFSRVQISEAEIPDSLVNETLQKLKQGYPANYLSGYIDIQRLHIFLSEEVLIPRNETAQFIFDYVKHHMDLNGKKALDLCTGSGFIALAIKKLYPQADVYASDISEAALTLAKQSAAYNHLSIRFLKSDFLKQIEDTFDIIFCNPPYIEEDSIAVDAPFEPALALYSGKDGLDSYRSIFADLPKKLNHPGFACLELESTNSKNTEELFHTINPIGYHTSIWQDWYQRDRYLLIEG